jgi:hypothetical protein
MDFWVVSAKLLLALASSHSWFRVRWNHDDILLSHDSGNKPVTLPSEMTKEDNIVDGEE